MRQVATFYRFVALNELQTLQQNLALVCDENGLVGTILLAHEGINATLAGTGRSLAEFFLWLEGDERFSEMTVKYSDAHRDNPVFGKLKVRVKPEIVSFGQPQVEPGKQTAEHVDWAVWNALLADPDVTVVDVRNQYEIEIGGFSAAIDPGTRNFREFPGYVDNNLNPEQQRRVAMYCTGGIRCEKASAYMLRQGFSQVYQLDGGILNYLETVPDGENQFAGECFVFDQRVSVTEALNEGGYRQCFACRRPLAPDALQSPKYRQGVSCPNCFDESFQDGLHDDSSDDFSCVELSADKESSSSKGVK